MIELISKPSFKLPSGKRPRADQLQGSEAEQLIEFAGRVCYNSLGTGRNSKEYAEHILSSGHGSILEHATFSFFVTGFSRNMLLELERHRVGVALSVRSTRFVDEGESKRAVHPVEDLPQEITEGIEKLWGYANMLYYQVFNHIEGRLISKGVDERIAAKQARAAARNMLPGGLETEFVWTANLRAIRHVIEMRASDDADAEIRLFATQLLEIMFKEAPYYMSDYEVRKAFDKTNTTVVKTKNRKI